MSLRVVEYRNGCLPSRRTCAARGHVSGAWGRVQRAHHSFSLCRFNGPRPVARRVGRALPNDAAGCIASKRRELQPISHRNLSLSPSRDDPFSLFSRPGPRSQKKRLPWGCRFAASAPGPKLRDEGKARVRRICLAGPQGSAHPPQIDRSLGRTPIRLPGRPRNVTRRRPVTQRPSENDGRVACAVVSGGRHAQGGCTTRPGQDR
jgi:hypothetical protein